MEIEGFQDITLVEEGLRTLTWSAHHVELNRSVLLQALLPEIAALPEMEDRFFHDVQAAARLRHPGIAHVFNMIDHDGVRYMVSELVEGQTLEQRLAAGRLPVPQAIQVARYLADALALASTQEQLTHRYLTPASIVLGTDGQTQIRGLGLEKPADAHLLTEQIRARAVVVNPSYLAPEQVLCEDAVGPQVDMYALGALLYHMLTGVAPFADVAPLEAFNLHLAGQLPHPRDLGVRLPEPVVNLIARLMAKDPAQRFSDWPAVIRVLAQRHPGLPPTRHPPTADPRAIAPPSETATPDNTVPAWLRAVAAVFMVGTWAGLGGYLWHHPLVGPPPGGPRPFRAEPVAVRLAAPSAPGAPAPVPPAAGEDNSAGPADDAAAGATPGDAEAPTAAGAATAVSALGEAVAQELVALDFPAAALLLRNARSNPPADVSETDLDGMAAYVRALAAVRQHVGAAFKAKMNEPAELYVAPGQSRPIIVRAVAGDRVAVDVLRAPDDPTPVRQSTFTLAKLSPQEQARWLGEPETAEQAGMLFILYAAGGNMDKAQTYADRCGPLAAAFGALAER